VSLFRHVRRCNAWEPGRFIPLLLGGERIGRVRRDNARALARFPEVFEVAEDRVMLRPLGDFDALTAGVDRVVEALAAEGVVPKWRHEDFSVRVEWGHPPVLKIDRGAVSFLGIRSFGVHLNGFRRDGGELKLWIGRRAPDKRVEPNKLDNMVAGGIGHGFDEHETLLKEGEEEAGVPRALMRRATPAGALLYRMEVATGLRDDALFVYDLEVPEDFVPVGVDGEITEFQLLPASEVLERVRAGDEFKFNVNLVIIDFAIRHGLIRPSEPDYLALLERRRGP
jgi:8-oxo-dGTP pyrophosphatase MutT (NUDIX family)